MVDLRPRPRAFVATPRKLGSRSLTIRGLESGYFRDQLIAAPLKHGSKRPTNLAKS